MIDVAMSEDGQSHKRKRLSHACNLCRSRKVRCDEQMPNCGNCQKAGAICITINPRKPAQPIISRRKSLTLEAAAVEADDDAVAHQLLSMERSQNSMAAPSLSPLSATRSSVHIVSPHSQILGIISDADQPADDEANDGDVAYNVNAGDDSTSKRKFLGASNLQVLIQWLDFSFSVFGVERNLSSFFQFGMSDSEEIAHPLVLSLPPLPPEIEYGKYVDTFFSRIHPLFPLLDERKFRQSIRRFIHADLNNLPSSELAMLSCIYSAIALGADELAGRTTEIGSRFVAAAFHLYPHLIGYPYRTSVQATLLLVLAFRGLNKDGSSCNINGQAVRLAMSIGLHRKSSSKNASDDPELDARVWWVTYCLEKILGFESGRPSAIEDSECDQMLPTPLSAAGEPDFFGSLIGLSKLRSVISTKVFRHRPVPRSIEEHLRFTGELDQDLQDWAETVPKDVRYSSLPTVFNRRPGCDIFCSPDLRPFAGFLSLQFHETFPLLRLF
jgi:Fungal specific transcription factor domain/Fungal Zn(2)-Cys(6) binuclear cluster domain